MVTTTPLYKISLEGYQFSGRLSPLVGHIVKRRKLLRLVRRQCSGIFPKNLVRDDALHPFGSENDSAVIVANEHSAGSRFCKIRHLVKRYSHILTEG